MPAELKPGLLLAASLAAVPAHAQTADKGSRPEFTLTEQGAPTARPWQKAAIVSGTIDRAGKDYVEIHANADLQFELLGGGDRNGRTRTLTLGPNVSWNRSTRDKREQNEFKAGAVLHLYDDPNLGTVDPHSSPLSFALQANADYARTAVYPDRSTPPCDAATTNPLCDVQHRESLKAKLSFFPYLPGFEDLASRHGFAFSFRPQFQIAHDQALNTILDPATLIRATGGYTSVLVGAGLNVRPRFISPQFELNGTVQLRQRIGASRARAAMIDRSPGRMELSATYYIAQDDDQPKTKNWRVGVSATWTEGSDPFEGQEKASTILFGVRIGRL